MRADKDSGNILEGHAAVFDQQYEVNDFDGTYNEVIERGAFNNSVLTDAPFTFNHNINLPPMARSRKNNENSTLQLKVDNIGLSIKALLDIENNEDSRKTYSAISRGDMDEMSYIFATRRDENGRSIGEWWENLNNPSTIPTRHITDIARVYEVSAVTWGANPGTDISARNHGSPESESALERARNELESLSNAGKNTKDTKPDAFNMRKRKIKMKAGIK